MYLSLLITFIFLMRLTFMSHLSSFALYFVRFPVPTLHHMSFYSSFTNNISVVVKWVSFGCLRIVLYLLSTFVSFLPICVHYCLWFLCFFFLLSIFINFNHVYHFPSHICVFVFDYNNRNVSCLCHIPLKMIVKSF